MFHIGHVEFLKKAKELGDYLLVGVYDDAVVHAIHGSNYPIMNLHERVLSVLACKYVDEVIIGAPYIVSRNVLDSVGKVSIVCHGSNRSPCDMGGLDPYKVNHILYFRRGGGGREKERQSERENPLELDTFFYHLFLFLVIRLASQRAWNL